MRNAFLFYITKILISFIYFFNFQPYFGYSTPDVLDLIRSRQLLPCPDLCPPRMYSLMVECWAELPHRRPSFEELHSRLKTWLLPLLGPNCNFSQHINTASNCSNSNANAPAINFSFPFAPPSCASNNSMSSHQSKSSNATGPLSNNTNSTSVSQQWPQQKCLQTFQNSSNNSGHCVAYQTTPIVLPQNHNLNQNGGPGGGGYYQNQKSIATAQAHFHPGTGRISHSTANCNSHSPSSVHYRVFMESKSTNI